MEAGATEVEVEAVVVKTKAAGECGSGGRDDEDGGGDGGRSDCLIWD